MRRAILVLITVLLVLSVTTLATAAPAMKIPITGSFTGYATGLGKSWITKGGILHVKDSAGEGPVSGDLLGWMTFRESVSVNLNTGNGTAHGKFVFSDDYGSFEGSFRTKHWGVVYYEGIAVGHGTGAYEGMLFKVTSFWGYNWYVGGYQGPDGIYFEFEATILSTKGVELMVL